jgi:hypothetical protein
MTQQLDVPSLPFVTHSDEMPTNSRVAASRREETRIEVLAHEIARYMPEIAEKLAWSGRRRLLAA